MTLYRGMLSRKDSNQSAVIAETDAYKLTTPRRQNLWDLLKSVRDADVCSLCSHTKY